VTPPPSTAAATGHARSLCRAPGGTRPARRVSGPSRAAGGARAARAARAAAGAPAAPRRARTAPAPRRSAAGTATLPLPLVGRLGALVESRWLDRLLRGRGWIVLIAVGLMGLVFLQVSLLKLNAGIGAAVERSAELERANADLSAEISKLGSNDRIQQLATRAGMTLPPSNDVRYLGKNGRRIGGASAALVPSQAEASTATLPSAPTTDGELAPADPAATATTPADPAATAAEPQTTSSVPLTPEQRAEQGAGAVTAGAATPDPAAAGTTTAPPPADPAADAGAVASTGGAAVGGAAVGG